jgi:hypothetical protein
VVAIRWVRGAQVTRRTFDDTGGIVSSGASWVEGPVSRDGEYFRLWYDPEHEADPTQWIEAAVLSRRADEVAVVEFVIDALSPLRAAAVADVVRDIQIILGDRDPWWYARRWAISAVGNYYGTVHWGYFMPLEQELPGFMQSLREFEGFKRQSFKVGELRADSNWPWGYAFGVYCFLVAGRVVYVGRAAGNTLGERLSDQLRSTSDPGWAAVVTADENTVEVFLVDKDSAHLACALECYLIAKLSPEFNLRSV